MALADYINNKPEAAITVTHNTKKLAGSRIFRDTHIPGSRTAMRVPSTTENR